ILERSPSTITRTKNHQQYQRRTSRSVSTSNTSVNLLPLTSSTIVIINEQKYKVQKARRNADKVFFLSERIELTKQQPAIG
ncbi:unnamed protein product, partial [Rotaria sp. Silwood1]